MNPLKDPVVAALAIAFGLALGSLIMIFLQATGFRTKRAVRKLKCRCGFHAASGTFVPAVGGRDVMRCLYCDEVVYEVQRTKNSLKRTV